MAIFSTPLIKFEKLPAEIIDWVRHRLMEDETVQLSIFHDIYNDSKFFVFYFLTTQKLLILETNYDQKNKIHHYTRHRVYPLGDIYQMTIEAEPGSYINHNVTSHIIRFRAGGDGYFDFSLDPQTANKFEVALLSLLWIIKPHA
ncbi:MAG: hypothetical protein HY258_05910 [Chloroflexi bacterium]|nr:hypothetical protein [Chloroflexota bacterium]